MDVKVEISLRKIEQSGVPGVLLMNSKSTFSIARYVIMIGLYSEGMPRGISSLFTLFGRDDHARDFECDRLGRLGSGGAVSDLYGLVDFATLTGWEEGYRDLARLSWSDRLGGVFRFGASAAGVDGKDSDRLIGGVGEHEVVSDRVGGVDDRAEVERRFGKFEGAVLRACESEDEESGNERSKGFIFHNFLAAK